MGLPATVRVNTTVNFPSLVFGTGPVSVTKNNGVWAIGLTANSLGALSPGFDPSSKKLIVQDATTNAWSTMAFSAFPSIAITSLAASLAQGITVNMSLAGAGVPANIVAGNPSGAFNGIGIASDNAAITGSGIVYDFAVVHKLGGAGTLGGRVNILGWMIQTAATDAANANRYYVGVTGIGETRSGDGGTNTGAGSLGAIFGGNFQTRLNGPNIQNSCVCEFDSQGTATGTTKYQFGISIADGNINRGASWDTAIAVYGFGLQNLTGGVFGPGTGFMNILSIGEVGASGLPAMNPAGTVIGAHLEGGLATINAAIGIDFTKFTFSGNPWQSNHFAVAQSGFLTVGPGTNADLVPLSIAAQANAAFVSQVTGTTNQVHIAGPDGSNNQQIYDSFGAQTSFLFRRADGTAQTRTGLVANDSMLNINAIGWTSAGAYTGNAAAIQMLATETWSGTANGSQVVLRTTPNTTNALAIALTVQNSGGVSVGSGAADPGIGALLATDLYTNNATFFLRTKTALTNGAAAAAGTLTNAPAAGNPTKWISVDDNGTTRKIPAW